MTSHLLVALLLVTWLPSFVSETGDQFYHILSFVSTAGNQLCYTQGHSLPYKELRHTVSGFFNFLYEETNRRQRSSSLIVCFCFIDIMYPINWERAGTYIFINYIAWGMRDCLQLSCKAPRVVLSTRWIGVSVRRYLLFSPLLETLSLLTNRVNQINSGDITGFRDSPTIIDYDSR